MLLHTRQSLVLLIICLGGITGFAQSSTTVSIEVADPNLSPLANMEVMLQENSTQQKLKALTDSKGKVEFIVTSGNYWTVYINGYRYDNQVVEREENSERILSLYITHNPALFERLNKQVFLRNSLQLQIIDQSGLSFTGTKAGTFNIEIKLVNSDGILQTGKNIHIVCLAEKKMYVSVTNAKGMAVFQLPLQNAYDIDVAEQLNASFIDKDLPDGYTFYKTIVYDTYDMIENNQQDTITQKIHLPLVKKNSRAPYSVQMKWKDGMPCSHEQVYLNDIIGHKVYMATTDSTGEALFILPFGEKYLVSFNFQKDVDVLDLTDARGRAEGSLSLIYQPNPALEFPEKFIPTPAELLLTDFSYYHKTPYPQPKKILQPGIFLRPDTSLPKQDTKEAVLEIGITALHIPPAKRTPLNVSFVLDKSGSMAGYERIESLKEGLEKMINQLLPDDRISIFLFDDKMELLLPSAKIGDNKKRIIELIRAIQPGGGTNMLKAMEAAYNEVLKHYTANAVNTVVLLTDGFDSNPVEILVAAQKPFNATISCTAIGVGKDYNYDLMKQLASKGNGLLIFAAEGKELVDLFAKNMLNLANPVARNVQLEITIPPAAQITKAYGVSKDKISGNRFTAAVPDLYRGMEIPVLIHFLVNKKMADNRVMVNLRYLDPATGKQEIISEEMQLLEQNNGIDSKKIILLAEQKKIYAVAFVNEQLFQMATAFENGETAKAGEFLEKGITKLAALYPETKDPDLLQLFSVMKKYHTAFINIANKRKLKR